MRLLHPHRPDRLKPANDSGFTMVELIVTMFVIGSVLLGLITVQVQALRTVELSKQRQQATALANRTMEQLRALPYDIVTAGLNENDLTVDPQNLKLVSGIWRFKPAYNSSINEILQKSAGQVQPPLAPHIQQGAATKLGQVQYRVRTYVTVPNGLANQGYFLTVVVDWSSSVTSGQTKTTAVRSRFSPTNCISTPPETRPFGGACQAFFSSDASMASADITVIPVPSETVLVGTADISRLEATLPSVSTQTQSEQTVSARSTVGTSEATVTQAGITATQGGQTASSAADVDAASGIANSPATETSVTYSGATPIGGGGGGVGVDAIYSVDVPGASGSAYSTTAAAASPVCADTAAVALVTNQVCSSGNVSPAGTYSAAMSLSVSGRNLGDTVLATVTAPGSSWRAVSGRAMAPISGHCSGTSGAGCVAAEASRNTGDTTVGSLPSPAALPLPAPPDVLPAGFTSMVILDDLTAAATAEAGITVAPNATPVSRTAGVGSSYWDGTGYAPLSVAAPGATQVLGIATGTYTISASQELRITLSGTVIVNPASIVATGTAPCALSACSVTATVGAVRVSVQYDLVLVDLSTTPATESALGGFVVTSSSGSTVAQTTYKAAPIE